MENFKKKDGFEHEKMFVLPTESFSDYLEHGLVKALYLTDAGFFPEAKHHYRERKEGCLENILIYCIDGMGTIELSDSSFNLSKNNIFCIPANTPHKYYADKKKPWSLLWIHFKGNNTIFYPINQKNIIEIPSKSTNDRLQSHFIMLFDNIQNGYSLGNIIYTSQILSLILSDIFFREKEKENKKLNQYLSKTIEYMYENLENNLTLDDMASYIKLSKSYLISLFKVNTKRTPLDFYIHLKMQQACKYLKMTDMMVWEVAKKLGYDDQFYFSRVFKKNVGVSPNKYKNM